MPGIDDFMHQQDAIINRVGWTVTLVMPTDDDADTTAPFAYTVGLTAHFTDRPLCDQVVRARIS